MKTLAILVLTLVVFGCSEEDPTTLAGSWESAAPLKIYVHINKNGDYSVSSAHLVQNQNEFEATPELVHRGDGETIRRLYLNGEWFNIRMYDVHTTGKGSSIMADKVDFITPSDSTRVLNLLFTRVN
jgi:hypothetical protein